MVSNKRIFLGLLLFLMTILSSPLSVAKNSSVKPDVVKLSRQGNSDHWFVDGFVDKKSYRFVLDTGAAFTRLSYDDFTSNFKEEKLSESSGAFAKHSASLITVPSVQISSLYKKSVQVARAPKNSNDQNLLGMNFLKDFALYFQFRENKVTVLRDDRPNTSLQDLFLGERFHPYVDISWGEIKAKGVWDTGAGMTCFDLGFIKKHSEIFKQTGKTSGKDSSGSSGENPLFLMNSFALGGKVFPSTTVVGIDLSIPNSTIRTPMDFILGENVLKQADWIFDFPNKKWAIAELYR
jgi:clan AA aspartic protease (TIGR02281 family)